MTTEERRTLIEAYARGHADLLAALAGCPEAAIDFKPGPGKWSIREIIIHMADSEAYAYTRCRTFISEPGRAVLGYDQDAFASALRYSEQDMPLNLELFRLLRLTTWHVIRNLREATWANKAEHSEHGWMTLDDWLVSYVDHVDAHVKQIARNRAAFDALPR